MSCLVHPVPSIVMSLRVKSWIHEDRTGNPIIGGKDPGGPGSPPGSQSDPAPPGWPPPAFIYQNSHGHLLCARLCAWDRHSETATAVRKDSKNKAPTCVMRACEGTCCGGGVVGPAAQGDRPKPGESRPGKIRAWQERALSRGNSVGKVSEAGGSSVSSPNRQAAQGARGRSMRLGWGRITLDRWAPFRFLNFNWDSRMPHSPL